MTFNVINRELFCLKLLTGNRVASSTRLQSWLVQEFLALTLLTNREVAKVLSAYGPILDTGSDWPKSIYDQWLSRRIRSGRVAAEVADAAARKECRQQIVRLRGKAYEKIERESSLAAKNVEHVAIRFAPVSVTKPQSRDQAKERVLLIAYHLEKFWLQLMLADLCPGYLQRSVKEKLIPAAMLTKDQWSTFAEKLGERQGSEGGNANLPIVLHAPAESGVAELMTIPGKCFVAEDMPALRTNAGRLMIHYKTKHSVKRPLAQVSLANVLQPPSVENPLLNPNMSALPDLAKLDHKQKDQLIATLWTSLTALRQGSTAAPADDNADKAG